MDGRLHNAGLRDQPAAVLPWPPLLAPDDGDRRVRGPRYRPFHSPAGVKPGQAEGPPRTAVAYGPGAPIAPGRTEGADLPLEQAILPTQVGRHGQQPVRP